MKTRLQEQMSEYKKIETYSHITLEDVLNKVTQEIWELIEASLDWNKEEMFKEAGDVIVNILSVCEELWIDIDTTWEKTEINSNKVAILLGKWNSKVQSIRNRYSREDVNVIEVQMVTSELVKAVLNYSDPSMDLWQIIKRNTSKFDSRKELYKPQIDLWDYIESYEWFPKPWINFKDIWPMLKSKEALDYAVKEISRKCTDSDIIEELTISDIRKLVFSYWVSTFWTSWIWLYLCKKQLDDNWWKIEVKEDLSWNVSFIGIYNNKNNLAPIKN